MNASVIECEYCSMDERKRFNEERKRLFKDEFGEVYINSIDELEFEYLIIPFSLELPIKYCPMCGRKFR